MPFDLQEKGFSKLQILVKVWSELHSKQPNFPFEPKPISI